MKTTYKHAVSSFHRFSQIDKFWPVWINNLFVAYNTSGYHDKHLSI